MDENQKMKSAREMLIANHMNSDDEFSTDATSIRRNTDGFFKEEYSHKIAGIISAHRLDHRIISVYRNVLYINPYFEDLMDVIKIGVPIDEVLTFRDIPLSD